MKKTTYSNYKKIFPKSFLLLLIVANFVFAADKCAIPSNSAIEISLSKTLPCDEISLNNCIDENISFLESKNTSAQNSFLNLGAKISVVCLSDEVKNLSKISYSQNSLGFGIDKTIA